MNFNVNDISVVETEKQYIDTVLVPVIHMNFERERIRSSAVDAHFITTVASFIETQLKGRILLLPPTTYTEATLQPTTLSILREELIRTGFKHVLFLTCDSRWTTNQEGMTVIWLPAIPLESMDNSMKIKIVEEQFKQVLPTLTNIWSQQQLTNL